MKCVYAIFDEVFLLNREFFAQQKFLLLSKSVFAEYLKNIELKKLEF